MLACMGVLLLTCLVVVAPMVLVAPVALARPLLVPMLTIAALRVPSLLLLVVPLL